MSGLAHTRYPVTVSGHKGTPRRTHAHATIAIALAIACGATSCDSDESSPLPEDAEADKGTGNAGDAPPEVADGGSNPIADADSPLEDAAPEDEEDAPIDAAEEAARDLPVDPLDIGEDGPVADADSARDPTPEPSDDAGSLEEAPVVTDLDTGDSGSADDPDIIDGADGAPGDPEGGDGGSDPDAVLEPDLDDSTEDADGESPDDTEADEPDTADEAPAAGENRSLRFYGNGGLYDDRIRIRLDDPETNEPGPAVDVGATDFTIELWLRAAAEDNSNAISCGDGIGWVGSNIVIDRDRHSQAPTFGIGIASDAIIFAVCDQSYTCYTLCGSVEVTDDAWHHVAVQRALDGTMQILVDGALDEAYEGPAGDISYPDDGDPSDDACPGMDGSCDYSDPFLVFGAEKHGYGGISFSGFLDEIRLSDTLRYGSTYTVPTAPFADDEQTVGLYHFDEGAGLTAMDSSSPPGGPTHGEIRYGGSPPGPEWMDADPFE